jgi:hypothetical protein
VDNDGAGDACDACPEDPLNDSDGDGRCANVDNCPAISNAGQQDADRDNIGDACDPFPNDPGNGVDSDGDGVIDLFDDCPGVPNPTQADFDHDAVGDSCDNCDLFANANQADSDNDGLGDACEFKWGDVAPAAGPNGSVDVGDAVRVLRFSVGLDNPTAEDLKRGNVAPLTTIVSGPPDLAEPTLADPRRIDVGDAVVILRASVGLVSFTQPH